MIRKEAGHLSLQASGHVYLTIIPVVSERVEPLQQFHFAFPSWRLTRPCGRLHFLQSLAFGFQTSPRVDVCRIEALMSEPVTNHRHVNACRDKTYRGGMSKLVWGDSLTSERWDLLGRCRHILLQLKANSGSF